jgi:hypothetical protein
MSHTVEVTMSLSVSAKGKIALMAAGGGVGGDEAARLQKAADANLGQLISAAHRYGFDISNVRVKVS